MKRTILILLFFFTLNQLTPSLDGQAKPLKIPDNVETSFEWLLKTDATNGIFNLENKASYFYVLKDAVYVNILFTAQLKEDQQEINRQLRKIHQQKLKEYDEFVSKFYKKLDSSAKDEKEKWKRPPKPQLVKPIFFHDLYVRIIQDKQTLQNFKSPVPVDQEEEQYYSFALILRPGPYDILININRRDDSKDGTMILHLKVPELTFKDITEPESKIEYTAPVFFRKIMKAEKMENRFAVFKNKYAIAPQQLFYYPCFKNEFTREEKPILAFFLKGFVKKEIDPPWNIKADLGIYKAKQRIIRYQTIKLNNPYFYQILDFSKIDGTGDYQLGIQLNDQYNPALQGIVAVPFRIIDPLKGQVKN